MPCILAVYTRTGCYYHKVINYYVTRGKHRLHLPLWKVTCSWYRCTLAYISYIPLPLYQYWPFPVIPTPVTAYTDIHWGETENVSWLLVSTCTDSEAYNKLQDVNVNCEFSARLSKFTFLSYIVRGFLLTDRITTKQLGSYRHWTDEQSTAIATSLSSLMRSLMRRVMVVA